MTHPALTILEVRRVLSTGNTESLSFSKGVNLLVGAPNTGKTKWLETIDYLLGDVGEEPFAHEQEGGLSEKYDRAGMTIELDGEILIVERRWREAGAKSKIFVDEEPMGPGEFQRMLMERLDIPIVHYPSGDPTSGRTWPELSFRELLRHIYRQQRYWNDIADRQSEDAKRAAVHQFLGLAEVLYSEDYETVSRLQREIRRLSAQRDNFADTLSDLARDFLGEDALSAGLTRVSLDTAIAGLESEYQEIAAERERLLNNAVEAEKSTSLSGLMTRRSNSLTQIQQLKDALAAAQERREEIESYSLTLIDEARRLERAGSASRILSDLKITHCPACDQSVADRVATSETCFLCSQSLTGVALPDEVAEARLNYEKNRIRAEQSESEQLLAASRADIRGLKQAIRREENALLVLERELRPAQTKVSAMVQENISTLDKQLGSVLERTKQLQRVENALRLREELDVKIGGFQEELNPILERYRNLAQGLPFEVRSGWIEDGMIDYFNAINTLQPETWRHSGVNIYLSKATLTFRVGDRRWGAALGGTDSLYFLMAYHYALMALQRYDDAHAPGLCIIDIPADFAGEQIGSAENFVVEPFINLLSSEGFEDCQIIITGAAFDGLENVNRIELTELYLN